MGSGAGVSLGEVQPASTSTVSVLVVDGHTLVAHGIAIVLREAGCDAHACTPHEHAEVLERVRALRPDVVLLDLALSGYGEGDASVVASLRGLGVEVVALTASTDSLALAAAVEAGANGAVSKMAPVDDLAEMVRRAARGEPLLSIQRRTALIDELRRDRIEHRARLAPFATLTRREAAVLERLMQGESAELVSAKSFVSLTTVRTQIRAILTKLGVSSQLAAVAMAYRAGWAASASQ